MRIKSRGGTQWYLLHLLFIKHWRVEFWVWMESSIFIAHSCLPRSMYPRNRNKWINAVELNVVCVPNVENLCSLEDSAFQPLRKHAFWLISLVVLGSFQEDKGEPSIKFLHVSGGIDGDSTSSDDFDWPRWGNKWIWYIHLMRFSFKKILCSF